MARGKTKPLSATELKSFRHSVSILKKKGLISKTDARSAQPYWIRGGNRLDKLVAKFDDVISGKVSAVEVSDKQVKQYRKAGFETFKNKVLIPHAAGERATVLKQGNIKVQKIVKPETGTRRIILPIPFHNLKQWIRDGKAQGDMLDSLKGGRKVWAYKFMDNNSYATYEHLELLFEELSVGTASGLNLMDKANTTTRKQQNEIYQNLALFAVPSQVDWPRRDIGRRKPPSAEARRRYRRRIKGSLVGERAMDRDAEAKRKYRKNLKGKNLVEYKRKAKKRAKKSRDRKK
jgi:hypothetical protein